MEVWILGDGILNAPIDYSPSIRVRLSILEPQSEDARAQQQKLSSSQLGGSFYPIGGGP